MAVTFVSGEMAEYISEREFSLNFEDRKVPSLKIKKGASVLYDGIVASCTNPKGENITSRAPSLKSAILSGWMYRKDGETVVAAPKAVSPRMVSENVMNPSKTDYDPKTGGSFDTYVGMDKDIHMARSGTSKRPVENYNERIVGSAGGASKPAPVKTASKVHEVSNDHVEVSSIDPAEKQRLVISNSTSINKQASTRKMPIIAANNSGAQASFEMTRIPPKKEKAETKRKTTLIDGSTMNSPLPDGATREDIDKVYGKRPVIAVDGEAQEGMVVKKIGEKTTVRSEEGITFRKTMPRTRSAAAVTSLGEASLSMDGSEQKVVRKIGKTASAHPEAQEPQVPEQAPTIPAEIKKEDGSLDYLSMLPENWARMHWVQKEKFVLSLNDVGFIKFLLTVETLPAVVNACNERLKQLEQPVNG